MYEVVNEVVNGVHSAFSPNLAIPALRAAGILGSVKTSRRVSATFQGHAVLVPPLLARRWGIQAGDELTEAQWLRVSRVNLAKMFRECGCPGPNRTKAT